jgi:hypothetical protein
MKDKNEPKLIILKFKLKGVALYVWRRSNRADFI